MMHMIFQVPTTVLMYQQYIHNYACHVVLNTGEFGIVYKAHLTHWHGGGPTKTVAVKMLKGTAILYMW